MSAPWSSRWAEVGPFEGEIPARLHASLVAYIERGVPCGHFGSAVLSNDLKGAVASADDDNLVSLQLIVSWLYNVAPALCWGTPERVSAWVARGGAGVERVECETVSEVRA